MTRVELALVVYDNLPNRYKKIPKRLVLEVVKLTFLAMKDCLIHGEKIKLNEFGTLEPQYFPSHQSWSQQSKKMVNSRPYMKINFRMSKTFKRAARAFIHYEKKGDIDG